MTRYGLMSRISMSSSPPLAAAMSCQLTSQEAVELHEQLQVDIVALRRLAVRAANMMSVEIDTYTEHPVVSLWSSMLFANRSCDTRSCADGHDPCEALHSVFRQRRYICRDTRRPLAHEGVDG